MCKIDLTAPAQEILAAPEFELIKVDARRVKGETCRQGIDWIPENLERVTGDAEIAVDSALVRMHSSPHRDLTGKCIGSCAEQFGELTEVVDGAGDVAAKVGTQPIGAERVLATEGEFVEPLLDIEFLQLDRALVKIGANHNDVGVAIAPAEAGELSPEGAGGVQKIAGIAAETNFRCSQRACDRLY